MSAGNFSRRSVKSLILLAELGETPTEAKQVGAVHLNLRQRVQLFWHQRNGMISPEQVEVMIKAELPDAQVQVQDLTGGGDHYQVTVVSSLFEGKGLVQQHQMVYGALRQAMSTEAIHALALKTSTPQKA